MTTFPQIIADTAQRTPEKVAITTATGDVTYQGLDDIGARVAAGLAHLGIGPDDGIGILCTNRSEWLAVLTAAGRLGSALTAFDTWSRRWDLDYLLEHSGVSVLVVLASFRGRDYIEDLVDLVPEVVDSAPGTWRSARYLALTEVIVIGGNEIPRGARRFEDVVADEPYPSIEARPDGVAVVLYTSGSSARPKAVPLHHADAVDNAFNIGERMRLAADDRVLVAVPMFWSYGLANATFATVTHGATVVVQEAFEPGGALDLIERHECTAIYTLPNMTATLLAHESFAPERVASLRTGLTIGSPEDVRRAAEDLGVPEICNVYGSTETYGNCAVTPCTMPLEQRMHTQGPPLPGTTIRIVDPATGEDQPTGEVGEVWIGGHVSRGYVDAPQLSAQAFTADGFYRSGDLGFLDDDGCFHFVARATEMIKVGGINVSPTEVESFLLQRAGVRAAAVVGLPDPKLGQVVAAFVELASGAPRTPEELRALCREGLAGYKVPAKVTILDELPKTDTGKIDRRALREPMLPGKS